MAKRELSENPRVVSGRALVSSLSRDSPEFRHHELEETPSDGLCFVRSVLQQLQIDDPSVAWEVAMAVTQSLAFNRETWKDHLDRAEELHPERMVTKVGWSGSAVFGIYFGSMWWSRK